MPAPLLLWNDKLDAELLRRTAAGESSRAIARAMGTTKNSVLGRRWRLTHPKEVTEDVGPSAPRVISTSIFKPAAFKYHSTSKGHPFARRLFAEMNRQLCTIAMMAQRSGVSISTIKRWKANESRPSVPDLEACFNVLDMTMSPREKRHWKWGKDEEDDDSRGGLG